MVNPVNQTNTTIPLGIYEILREIKEQKGCTFDEVLNELCDFELKNNYIERVKEYDLCYNDVFFKFKVTFKRENIVFEYFTPAGEYSSRISEWGVPDKVRKEFFTFIREENARVLLEFMPVGLLFNDFFILRR